MKVIISNGPHGCYKYWIGGEGRGNTFAEGKSYSLEHCRTVAWMVLGAYLKGSGRPSEFCRSDWTWEENLNAEPPRPSLPDSTLRKMAYKADKIAGYAAALDTDINAVRYPLVVAGKVKHFFAGTVYGALVATETGTTFDTFEEARENACLFVQQCADALSKRS